MLKALYYPSTTIRNKDLIKTSLLLWDKIECIVPSKDWKKDYPFKENYKTFIYKN